MDITEQKLICRTCLTEVSKHRSLLTRIDGDDRTLREVLSNLTNVTISANDKYPKQVCDECHIMIIKADEFKRRCLQSESILKNGYHSLEELIKHELNNTDDYKITKSHIKSPVGNDACLDQRLKSNQSIFLETNIPVVDNFYSSADSLGENYNFVKEEQDDFLHDEIDNIIIDTTLVEKFDLESTKSTLCGLDIDIDTDDIPEKIDNKKISPLCTICNEQFSNYELLQTHLLTHKDSKDDSIKNYKCTTCEINCTCVESCEKKIKPHKSKTKFKIDKRKKKESKKILGDKRQGIVLTLICPKCTESFSDWQLFKVHLKTHINDPITIAAEHTQRNKNSFKNEKNYQCSLCMRTFARKMSLVAHIKRHKDSAQVKFTCKMCKREFQHRAHLENHVVIVHSKQEGFTCDVCSKSFSTQESLDSHNEGHKVDRKHECKICGKSFTMFSTLTAHLKIHTGEKPYLCSVCGRGFSQKTNLMQHMRRHQGLKPFKCNSCERRVCKTYMNYLPECPSRRTRSN